MRSPVGVIVELPEMYKLIDHAGIALEIPDKLFVLPALLERREADLLIEFYYLCHLADIQRVGSEFVERHRRFPFHCWVDHLERGLIGLVVGGPRHLRQTCIGQELVCRGHSEFEADHLANKARAASPALSWAAGLASPRPPPGRSSTSSCRR